MVLGAAIVLCFCSQTIVRVTNLTGMWPTKLACRTHPMRMYEVSMTQTLRMADEYRKMAADCREQSERAPNQSHMQNWLRIASQWDDLAEVADKHSLPPAPYLVGLPRYHHS